VSTAVFAVLFAVLAPEIGPVLADVVALGACSVANTAANRRLTFSYRGRDGWARHHRSALVLGLVPLVLSLAAIGVLGALGVTGTAALLAVLSLVSGTCALGRFVLLRRWVFRP
jgi:putative flippase GtrA